MTKSDIGNLHPDGSVKHNRVYNPDLTAKVDIEYSMLQGKMTLHAHDYVNGVRQPYRDLTPEEYEEYGKYFGGSK